MPLRPLAVGDVLSAAIGYIRANPLLTLGASAAIMLVTQVVQLVVDLTLPQPDPSALATGRVGWLAAAGQIGSTLVAVVLGALLTGLLFVVLSRAVLGQRIDVAAAWRAVAPRLAGLIGLTLLIGVAVVAVVVVVAIPAAVVAATGSGDAILLAVVLIMVATLVAVYLSVLWVLAPAAYVLEPIGVVAAIGRSRRLVHGVWWRTFGVLLLTALLVVVPMIVVIGVLGGLSLDPEDTGSMVRAAIGVVVASSFAVPFATGVTGLLYIDQRIRRERFDVELARWVGL
ncbi:hypothetical protein CFP66_06165 [Pseudonocardia sp. MH-G8]|nr:hypothetical protein CFP66_06165 [Pseudonocardia sp. MH-G8]